MVVVVAVVVVLIRLLEEAELLRVMIVEKEHGKRWLGPNRTTEDIHSAVAGVRGQFPRTRVADA